MKQHAHSFTTWLLETNILCHVVYIHIPRMYASSASNCTWIWKLVNYFITAFIISLPRKKRNPHKWLFFYKVPQFFITFVTYPSFIEPVSWSKTHSFLWIFTNNCGRKQGKGILWVLRKYCIKSHIIKTLATQLFPSRFHFITPPSCQPEENKYHQKLVDKWKLLLRCQQICTCRYIIEKMLNIR